MHASAADICGAARFSSPSLQHARHLLHLSQDLADSKRINTNVQSVPNTATPLRRRRHLVDIGAMQVRAASRELCTLGGTPMPWLC